jgi:hypothetical protein
MIRLPRKGRKRLWGWKCRGCGRRFDSVVDLCEHRYTALFSNRFECINVLDPAYQSVYRDFRDLPHAPRERIHGVTP